MGSCKPKIGLASGRNKAIRGSLRPPKVEKCSNMCNKVVPRCNCVWEETFE